MNQYKSIGIVNLRGGRIRLSPDEVKRRPIQLKQIEGDLFEIIEPIQLKSGVEFAYDGKLPKTLVDNVLSYDEASFGEAVEEVDENQHDEIEYPIHHGAGWYELSNGERVRGEEDALTRQTEIDEAG